MECVIIVKVESAGTRTIFHGEKERGAVNPSETQVNKNSDDLIQWHPRWFSLAISSVDSMYRFLDYIPRADRIC